jgi:di/tricarboxylate transporter
VQKFTDPRRGWFVTAGFALVIGLSAFGVVDFLKALLVLLGLFLVFGLVTTSELRRQMPYQIISIIASALVISEVMVSSGVGEVMAQALLLGANHFGPYGALALILLVTWLLTELMSNNAAAALAFPIALGVASQLGLQPQPFIMAVLYGASCSFLTPYGYQTNLMVMSPGRYTLGDFVRAGLPIALVFLLVSLWAIPVFFPFVAQTP